PSRRSSDLTQVQRRRIADALLPARIARQTSGGQLAAGTQGAVHADAADVLAESRGALDPAARQRLMDPPAGEEGRVTVPRMRIASVRTGLPFPSDAATLSRRAAG